jgi:uncharacterized membrane protein (DUF106 family)
MSIDVLPWYLKYWKILLAALGLILTGLLIAFSGRTEAARKNVNNLNKTINDIDSQQTRQELEEHKKKVKALTEEKEVIVKEQALVRIKLAESPSYDKKKRDAENMEILRKVTW